MSGKHWVLVVGQVLRGRTETHGMWSKVQFPNWFVLSSSNSLMQFASSGELTFLTKLGIHWCFFMPVRQEAIQD